jgi:hypothetical protein
MENISAQDREILRKRAKIQLEYANSEQNEIILKKWKAQAEGRREDPTVRLLFSNFTQEVITPVCNAAVNRLAESKPGSLVPWSGGSCSMTIRPSHPPLI